MLDALVREMVGCDVSCPCKPEQRDLGQYLALEGNRIRQHHVERRESIRGDDEQMLIIYIVDITHLSLVHFFEAAQARLKKRCRMRNLFHVQALATATIEGRRLWRDTACRSTRMSWNGILFGAMLGFLLTRSAWGAVAGAIIGYMLGPKAGVRFATPGAASISSEFFRTTFEIMG